ncbi:MAG: peptidylprolyl isomerase [Bacteroidales bacterium]|nr:peptidylprolyl isomerase [Bacteroidales bacterium]
MKKTIALVVAVLLLSGLRAQKIEDPVIFEIGDQKILKSEFMKDFLRSIDKTSSVSSSEKRQVLEDYVKLFVNYRAKLADAYALGMDTNADMLNELATYRKELSAPYLIDSATLSRLLYEAYERNQQAVHAAHILLPLSPMASPSDTQRVYNEAMALYNRLTLDKEDFFTVAREVMEKQMNPEQRERMAQNPQVKGHEGDLGFFTAFDMVYPFENAAYTIPVGEIGKPVRSRFGYHIIKVIDRVPYYGSTTLRHIWISDRMANSKAEGKIKMAYDRLMEGMPFEKVAHNYSDDRATSSKGGQLGSLAMQQMPPEYVSIVGRNAMKAGDISKPFHTEYGWHIIMVERRDTIPSFADMLPDYRQRISRDQRNTAPQSIFVEQCKQRYGFVDYTRQYGKWVKSGSGREQFVADAKVTKKSRYASSLNELVSMVNDSVFSRQWVFHPERVTDRHPLFVLDDTTYDAVALGQYIALKQIPMGRQDIAQFVQQRYDEFIAEKVLRLADSRLEQDNVEFRGLIDEYRHGLMIFNYNDDQIWSKALKDTSGFDLFYQQTSVTHTYENPEDSVYFWKDRARVVVYRVADSLCLPPATALKAIAKGQKKQKSASDIRLDLIEKVDRKHCKATQPVKQRLEVVEMGRQELLDMKEWKTGTYVHPQSKGYEVCVVEQLMPPMLKSKDEARGYYVNDFQSAMEQQLVERLHKKYNVVIHQDVVDAITY